MEIKAWKGFSKKKNSTKRPADQEAIKLQVRLKENTSVENPTFILLKTSDAWEYNYFYALGHYYYITDIVSTGNSTLEFRCQQDVLATYKIDIQNTVAHVVYSSSDYDETIPDSRLNMIPKRIVDTGQTLPGFGLVYSQTGCFILTCISTDASGATGACAMYALTAAQMQVLARYLTAQDTLDAVWVGIRDFFQNPIDCIVKCIYLPVPFTSIIGDDVNHITLGYVDIATGEFPGYPKLITTPHVSIVEQFHVRKRKGFPSFLDLEPYRTCALYLPFVGVVPFDYGSYFPAEDFYLSCSIDIMTGDVVYKVSVQPNTNALATYSGNCSASIPMSTQKADSSTLLSGAMTAIGGIATAIATKNASSLLGETASEAAYSSIASGAMEMARGAKITTQMNGAISSRVGVYLGIDPILIEIRTNPSEDPFSDMRISKMGLPLGKTEGLGNLYGYLETSNASVNIAGTSGDKSEVNAYLNSGIYLE